MALTILSNRSILLAPLLGAGLALAAATPAAALSVSPVLQSVAAPVQGGDPSFSGSIGYGFSLSIPLSLTALGFHDADEDGLLADHTVGLFDANSQALLASATVPAGQGAALVGGYRWVAIPDLLLQAGSYVIAATMPGDPARFDAVLYSATSVSGLPGFQMGAASLSEVGSGSAPTFPTVDEAVPYGFIGPNFAISSVPAPLPLFGAASAFAWSRRLRRRIGRPSPLFPVSSPLP